MWGRLLWGWGPALTQASSRAMTPASTSMMAVYSGQEVETALLMAAQSLALKNRAIDALHAQLEAVELRLAAAREQRGSGMQDQTRTAEAALAAELAHLQARCQTAELQAATLVKRLADALAVTDRQARDIEAAHERSSAVKRQLAAVKAELAEAKAAQGSAVAALGELEAALAELREESTALRHEKDEVGGATAGCCLMDAAGKANRAQTRPRLVLAALLFGTTAPFPRGPLIHLLQLQAMLTARESAYLTLLETVQVTWQQPVGVAFHVCTAALTDLASPAGQARRP